MISRAPPSFATSDDEFVASVIESCRRDSLVFRRSEQAGAGGGNLCLRIAGRGHDARCFAPAARRARRGTRFFDGRGGAPRSRPCWYATGSSCRSSAPSCALAMASRSASRTPAGNVGTCWSLRSTPRTRSTGFIQLTSTARPTLRPSSSNEATILTSSRRWSNPSTRPRDRSGSWPRSRPNP